jgi:hypothetical protein
MSQGKVLPVRFPGALLIKSVYSLPQALVGIKKWTDPDVVERNILPGPDDKQALEMAKGMQQHLVDTYKYVYPLMEVRKRAAFQNRSFFVGNDTLGRTRPRAKEVSLALPGSTQTPGPTQHFFTLVLQTQFSHHGRIWYSCRS